MRWLSQGLGLPLYVRYRQAFALWSLIGSALTFGRSIRVIYRARNESKVPIAMAGAYGIASALKFPPRPARLPQGEKVSCGVRLAPSDPCHSAHPTANAPPTKAVKMDAVKNWPGPTHAPTPAASLRSPIPIAPRKQGIPNKRHARPTPARLRPAPGHLPLTPWRITPAARNGSTSQLGIRRLRRSIPEATARTLIVDHQTRALTGLTRSTCISGELRPDISERTVDIGGDGLHPRSGS